MEAEERTTQEIEPGAATKDTTANDIPHESPSSDEDARSHHEEDEPAQSNGTKRKRTPPPEGMTISAFKKLKRQQRWEAGKADRKLKKKEAEKRKKEARRAAIASGEAPVPAKLKATREKGTQVPVTIVIDCGFDDLMTEQEIKSLASQITRCYSDNSRSRFRVNLAVSGFDKRLRERFDTVLGGQYKGWKGIKFYEEDFVEVAGMAREKMGKDRGEIVGALAEATADGDDGQEEEVVYLSSESENTIEHLSPYSTYVIGGIVDRNRHKGICYKRACDRGIKTAKLPIGEFMEMNSRQVLATNHVNEIMLHWLEVGGWGEAFMKVIPKRKGGVLKDGGKNGVDDGEAGENAEDGEDGDDAALGASEVEARVHQAEGKAENGSEADAKSQGKGEAG